MYRGWGVSRKVRPTTWKRFLKKESSKPLVLKSYSEEGTLWDSSQLVSLTIWDMPALFTTPIPLEQRVFSKGRALFRG